ncbi:MAG: penicillin acylase family protein [Gemmatimonadetes bacterium]|nr:penicillin acylase family protein [Gemmatimonadota bacterium]
MLPRFVPLTSEVRSVTRCASASRAAGVLALAFLPHAGTAQAPDLSAQVEIRRTAFGVPHVFADNFRAAGYALGWLQLEDYGPKVAYNLYRNRGELALRFGRDSIEADFANRPRWLRAVEAYPALSADVRAVYEGFAAGVNSYIELHRSAFPEWFRADLSGPDILTTDMEWPNEGLLRSYLRRIGAVPATAPGPRRGEGDVDALMLAPDEGSNAWALAPSRTRSGRAIMLRNPHLNWDAGYYEAHVVIPGELDFYGDFRIGGPFQTIGGFNARLGFSTTNNDVDPDELYLLDEDPARPDHYLFDGLSIPLRRTDTSLPYQDGDSTATETRTKWATHLGPVIHRADGKLHVWKVAGFEQFQLAEQWLGMMRARNFAEWQDAMRMLQKPSSNFTYADADGNIFYVSFGHTPRLRKPSGGDTIAVPARTSDDVWGELWSYDSLPHLKNPKGGYIHQENDPFHYTNLNEIIPADRYPDNFSQPALGLRSQNAISLIGGKQKFSLEDVVRLKHSYRMLLADRVKDELIAAARAAGPAPAVDYALALLERWDNTVAPESRGSTLFEVWWARYQQTAQVPPGGNRNAALWREVWNPAEPATTPRGLADPQRAVAALQYAVEETARRYGAWDVAWGDVHRVRRGQVDVPVGGCSGSLGCFRVLTYRQDADGKLSANNGDGWILAVEFGKKMPRAYSVLAYGESDLPDNEHYADQAAMFARGELKPVAFTQADIERQTIRRYRPGRE